MSRPNWFGGTVAAGSVLCTLAACTTVATVKNPGTYVASKQPRTVWLTKTDHSIVRMNGPRMVGDTVVGAVNGQYTEVAMTDVTGVQAIVPDQTKTIAVAAAGGAATLAALFVVFSHSGGSGGNTTTLVDSNYGMVTGRAPF